MFDPALALQSHYTVQSASTLKKAISLNYCVEETAYLSRLLALVKPDDQELESVHRISHSLITSVRRNNRAVHLMDKLLQEYSLDVEEGIVLMCLAEALLRIPDDKTADELIKDKLMEGDWFKHLGNSQSAFVNAASWGLHFGCRYLVSERESSSTWDKMVSRLGGNLIRNALKKAMALMGEHFVLGQSIDEALQRAKGQDEKRQCCSFDMLGEAALSQNDADTYFHSYKAAIYRIGRENQQHAAKHSISIKLSALHPRYEEQQRVRVLEELYQRVLDLVKVAIANNVAITIDAEEQDRFELYLDLFESLIATNECAQWGQLGLVIQAYSKRALPALVWLNALARECSTRIPIRLVKGAYWDSEIKLAQQHGVAGYPVFTLKEATDMSYLACVHFLLSEANGYLQPQFASHNVNTLACIRVLAERYHKPTHCLEFQRLHGMGSALHELNCIQTQSQVRTYAPVGSHSQLLPYLVRRLLENGANSSFLHHLSNDKIDPEQLSCHHYIAMKKLMDKVEREAISISSIFLRSPTELYQPERENSQGLNINVEYQRKSLRTELSRFSGRYYQARSLLAFPLSFSSEILKVPCSFKKDDHIGEMTLLGEGLLDKAFFHSQRAFASWRQKPCTERARCLERMADLLERHRAELIYLCQIEAGKTIADAIDEVREAVDFCRYYAVEACRLFSHPVSFSGPVGEENYLSYSGRGVFVCISPWNFPVAIFTGQIAAALVSGNCVIAKPAEGASLIAHFCSVLWHEAGVPSDVLQLVLAKSATVGEALTSNERIAGVAFTGSTDVAKQINRNLADKPGPIVPFIAETGGQNAMIVDSTALAEQVVLDVIHSAFNSAGQRCSALRVLYVQDDIADRIVELLKGAMQELALGSPCELESDIGPVISEKAKQGLLTHIDKMMREASLLYQCTLDESLLEENYIAPCVFEINSIKALTKEHFGPVLHLIRFSSDNLAEVIDELNGNPYGLTLGIHSRNHSFVEYIESQVYVGNIYINRNQVGAVVGVQPFGGEKMSGTGPKAGGPNYLLRFVTEHTHCENTAAMGGNPALLGGDSH